MSLPEVRRFVHFSDIHFGQERGHGLTIHDDVRDEVVADCAHMRSEGFVAGPADAVIVTGDLAYAGKEHEFRRAGAWLDRVTEAVGCGTRDVAMIAGNHDVDVAALGEQGKSYQRYLRTLPVDKVEDSLPRALEDVHNPLVAKLDAYRSFAAAYGADLDPARQPTVTWTYEIAGGRALRLVGLCSVLICDLEDRPGNMFLGADQYALPRSQDSELVVMVHHSHDWFMNKQDVSRYLQSRARVLMTGHEHLPDLARVDRGEWQQAHVAAGAMNPPQQTVLNPFTYNWIEFAWQRGGGRRLLDLKVFPRVWNPAMTRFDPDYSRTEGRGHVTIVLDCGPAPAASSAGFEVIPPPVEEGGPALTGDGALPVTGVDGDVAMDDVEDGRSVEALRFVFWRHLNRQARQDVLNGLGLVGPSSEPLPHAVERKAFDAAVARSRLGELWEATMMSVPEAERRPNPFKGGH